MNHHICPKTKGELDAKDQDFNHVVTINFEDGSRAKFQYAFAKTAGEALDVFTEHCGYHRFFLPSITSYTQIHYDVIAKMARKKRKYGPSSRSGSPPPQKTPLDVENRAETPSHARSGSKPPRTRPDPRSPRQRPANGPERASQNQSMAVSEETAID